MHDDGNDPIDVARNFAIAAWMALPCVAFLLTPVREGIAVRLAAALVVLAVMFAWATHSPNRSSRKEATLRAFRWLLHGATAITMTAGVTAAVAIGLFSSLSNWPIAAIPLAFGAMLRGLLWGYDRWVERDWRRFGRLDADGMPVIREMTMREFADAAITSRRRSWQLGPGIGFWGELLANNEHSDVVASMTTARRLLDATAAPGNGASFVATHEGSFARITPLTQYAASWLESHVTAESTWLDDTLVVEMRYFPDVAEAIIEAGFLFERNAYLS